MRDDRLVGSTEENIFFSVLRGGNVFATSFDTVALDGIVYDIDRRFFKVGEAPSYVQIKCRGSDGERFNPQGHSSQTFASMLEVARTLDVPQTSLYFVVGFFRRGDVRTVVYYGIPFGELERFKKMPTSQYRFSVELCERAVKDEGTIFRI